MEEKRIIGRIRIIRSVGSIRVDEKRAGAKLSLFQEGAKTRKGEESSSVDSSSFFCSSRRGAGQDGCGYKIMT